MKKSLLQARCSKIEQDGMRRSAPNYSLILPSKIEQDEARCCKIRKNTAPDYSQVLNNARKQDAETLKNVRRKFHVLDGSNQTPVCLYLLLPRCGPAPPPYTMESESTLQVLMETASKHGRFPELFKNKKLKTHEET